MNNRSRDYLLMAKLPAYKNKLVKALAALRKAYATFKTPVVSFSGGKDSTALLHMAMTVAKEQGKQVQAVNYDSGGDLPETKEFISSWEKLGVNLTVVESKLNLQETSDDYELRNKLSNIRDAVLTQPIKTAIKELGIDCQIVGLRREESKARKICLRLIDENYLIWTKLYNVHTLYPIADFNGEDIWAYIFSNHVPYHPEYDDERFEGREWVRVSPYLDISGHQRGRIARLRQQHPELWNKMMARWPWFKMLS